MDKRVQILTTAEKILAERGFYGLSMKLLADTAGIAAGTIYRYFENKEALMSELHKYIRVEAAQRIFNGWNDQQSAKDKYDLLWRNAYDAVLNNPQRLTVIEMLYFIPSEDQQAITLFEDEAFLQLLDFYQQGREQQIFQDWEIPILVTLSFDTAVNFAKKTLRKRIDPTEQMITTVRDASWAAILRT